MAGTPNSFALGRQSALAEAYGLYQMIQPECSVEELRELIAVPPHIERVLRAYANAHVDTGETFEEGSIRVESVRTISMFESELANRSSVRVDQPHDPSCAEIRVVGQFAIAFFPRNSSGGSIWPVATSVIHLAS